LRTANKELFIQKSKETIEVLYDKISELQELNIRDLKFDNSVLVIVDVINGFTSEGYLQSPRVEGIVADIVETMKTCMKLGIPVLAFADSHNENSPEFEAYAAHCLEDTSESEIVNEIKEIGGYRLILKNSTNGFLEKEFQDWLRNNSQIDTFIIVGDCTDLCIQQFALTLKTWFNMNNRKSRLIVPENIVDTFDYDIHNGDLMHVIALYNMLSNGIEVISKLKV
jgi:nicotinamidase-related amidase